MTSMRHQVQSFNTFLMTDNYVLARNNNTWWGINSEDHVFYTVRPDYQFSVKHWNGMRECEVDLSGNIIDRKAFMRKWKTVYDNFKDMICNTLY